MERQGAAIDSDRITELTRAQSKASARPLRSYLQGRASASQFQPPPEREQAMRLLAARPQRAQFEPYSRSVKSTHDLIAARCAAGRLR